MEIFVQMVKFPHTTLRNISKHNYYIMDTLVNTICLGAMFM